MKIDFYIPYVNSNDEFWKSEFIKYGNNIDTSFLSGAQRYRDQGILRYLLRSIEKYTPWVNDVYLVVAYESQIPDWIDRDKIKILYHKDFIPEKYLPVFNSNHIETFLGNIPSDYFVWLNDDLVINKPLTEEFFFLNGIPRYDMQIREFRPKAWGDPFRLNSYNLILNKNQDHFVVTTRHVSLSYRKDLCKECFEKYDFENTLGELHKPRQLCNICQYTYALYQWTKLPINMPKAKPLNVTTKTVNKLSSIYDWLIINDGETDAEGFIKVLNYLNTQFPQQSKYEYSDGSDSY